VLEAISTVPGKTAVTVKVPVLLFRILRVVDPFG
jgi:hypothetical protein